MTSIISAKIYELFLECFDYEFPDEKKVIELFESEKLQNLITEICPEHCSKTRQLIILQNLTNEIRKVLNTISQMRTKLSIPENKSDMPKITYSINHKLDELISLRRMKTILDKEAGFMDENGKSMYFEMPLTTAFHIYFKTLATN